MNKIEEDEDEWDGIEAKAPVWRCVECGHEDSHKPMPVDRAKFYARIEQGESPKCPKCKSIGFMPVGF